MAHSPAAARELLRAVGAQRAIAEFPALHAAIQLMQRKFLMVEGRWEEGAAANREAALTFTAIGRRTSVPMLGMGAAFAFLAAGDARGADEVLTLIEQQAGPLHVTDEVLTYV